MGPGHRQVSASPVRYQGDQVRFCGQRDTDHMTLDQIDAAIRNYESMKPGDMTPSGSDHLRELQMAKRRIVGTKDRTW